MKKRKPELLAAAGLFLYTIGRFVAAGGTMGQYGIDPRWFLFGMSRQFLRTSGALESLFVGCRLPK